MMTAERSVTAVHDWRRTSGIPLNQKSHSGAIRRGRYIRFSGVRAALRRSRRREARAKGPRLDHRHPHIGHLIGGQMIADGDVRDAHDPGRLADVVARVAVGTADDVNRAVAAAHQAFGLARHSGGREAQQVAPRRRDSRRGCRGPGAAAGREHGGVPGEVQASILDLRVPFGGVTRPSIGHEFGEARLSEYPEEHATRRLK
jgi:hypothetical protein